MNRKVTAALLPEGGSCLGLVLEWRDTRSAIATDAAALQQEIWNRFDEDPAEALLFLGFCDREVPLSPSLD